MLNDHSARGALDMAAPMPLWAFAVAHALFVTAGVGAHNYAHSVFHGYEPPRWRDAPRVGLPKYLCELLHEHHRKHHLDSGLNYCTVFLGFDWVVGSEAASEDAGFGPPHRYFSHAKPQRPAQPRASQQQQQPPPPRITGCSTDANVPLPPPAGCVWIAHALKQVLWAHRQRTVLPGVTSRRRPQSRRLLKEDQGRAPRSCLLCVRQALLAYCRPRDPCRGTSAIRAQVRALLDALDAGSVGLIEVRAARSHRSDASSPACVLCYNYVGLYAVYWLDCRLFVCCLFTSYV